MRGTTMGHLGPGFAGFSYEKSHMTDGFFTGTNAALIAMYNLLGPGVMRIGANDVDKTAWVPAAPQVAGGAVSPSVGTVGVDGLASFLGATGWKAIYGVRHTGSTPAEAASEATYVSKQLGASLAAFEIGNEPNFYGGGWAGFKPSWEAFTSAIRTAVPSAPMSGPGAFGASTSPSTSYADGFARDEAAQIVLLTQHYYIAGAGGGSTLADIVSAKPAVASMSQALSADVVQNKIRDGFRWAEMNSYAHHGAPGVSDALAAALWGIDFMLTTASYGSSGVNFHGGGENMDGNTCSTGPASCTKPFHYSPIDEAGGQVTSAAPLFYGMLLVSRAGIGPMLSTTATAGNLNFTGYAITLADGSTNVVLVNKDTATGVNASVDVGMAVSAASAVYLLGPSLGATAGLTFAGAGIGPKGTWTPNPPYALSTKGSVIAVLVPPASAVIVVCKKP